MVVRGSQWLLGIINCYHGFSMVIGDYHGFSMVIRGFQWLSGVFNGYQGLSGVTRGFQCTLSSMNLQVLRSVPVRDDDVVCSGSL